MLDFYLFIYFYFLNLWFIWIRLILLKTENNKKVTVHAFDTVHKPKITVRGQWIVPDARLGKKNVENITRKTQNPNTYLDWIPNLSTKPIKVWFLFGEDFTYLIASSTLAMDVSTSLIPSPIIRFRICAVTPRPNFIVNLCVQVINYYLEWLTF